MFVILTLIPLYHLELVKPQSIFFFFFNTAAFEIKVEFKPIYLNYEVLSMSIQEAEWFFRCSYKQL